MAARGSQREKIQMMPLSHSDLAELCGLLQTEAEETGRLRIQTICAKGFDEQASIRKNQVQVNFLKEREVTSRLLSTGAE